MDINNNEQQEEILCEKLREAANLPDSVPRSVVVKEHIVDINSDQCLWRLLPVTKEESIAGLYKDVNSLFWNTKLCHLEYIITHKNDFLEYIQPEHRLVARMLFDRHVTPLWEQVKVYMPKKPTPSPQTLKFVAQQFERAFKPTGDNSQVRVIDMCGCEAVDSDMGRIWVFVQQMYEESLPCPFKDKRSAAFQSPATLELLDLSYNRFEIGNGMVKSELKTLLNMKYVQYVRICNNPFSTSALIAELSNDQLKKLIWIPKAWIDVHDAWTTDKCLIDLIKTTHKTFYAKNLV